MAQVPSSDIIKQVNKVLKRQARNNARYRAASDRRTFMKCGKFHGQQTGKGNNQNCLSQDRLPGDYFGFIKINFSEKEKDEINKYVKKVINRQQSQLNRISDCSKRYNYMRF